MFLPRFVLNEVRVSERCAYRPAFLNVEAVVCADAAFHIDPEFRRADFIDCLYAGSCVIGTDAACISEELRFGILPIGAYDSVSAGSILKALYVWVRHIMRKKRLRAFMKLNDDLFIGRKLNCAAEMAGLWNIELNAVKKVHGIAEHINDGRKIAGFNVVMRKLSAKMNSHGNTEGLICLKHYRHGVAVSGFSVIGEKESKFNKGKHLIKRSGVRRFCPLIDA